MAKSNYIERISGYELTRAWFDFAFENQHRLCPSHTAMFLWFVELNNRMGWTEKFGSPASQTMSAIGLKSYNTYKKIFDDLVLFGFVEVVSESKNQWSSCIIALSNNNNAQYKALYNALDKALTKHSTTQSESTIQRTSSIIKPLNKETFKQGNQETKEVEENSLPSEIDLVLTKKIMDWFGFTETANFDKMRQVCDFQKCLAIQNKIQHFEIQFVAYTEFKSLAPKFKHSFDKFLGDKKILYEDGQWNAENWVEKLKTENENGNATTITNTATAIEQKRADRDGMGSLAEGVLAKIAAEYSD